MPVSNIRPRLCCLGLMAGMLFGADVSKSDKTFMSMAANFDMTQAHEGEMAINQAQSEEVRNYAKALVQDHTANYGKLRDLAEKTGASIPRGINAGTNNVIIQLTRLKGASFDRKFAANEVEAHRTELALVKQEAAKGKNADVKAFANSMIPGLEKHLRDAQECAKALGHAKHS